MIGGSEPLLAVAGLLVALAGLAPMFADGAVLTDDDGEFTRDAAGLVAPGFAATLIFCGCVERLATRLACMTLPCPGFA